MKLTNTFAPPPLQSAFVPSFLPTRRLHRLQITEATSPKIGHTPMQPSRVIPTAQLSLAKHYWEKGYTHLETPLPTTSLNTIGQELDKKLSKPSKQDPDKLHHRDAHLDRHIPEIRALLQSQPIQAAVRQVLGETGVLIRSTLIDKPPGSPWHVKWHQDRSPLCLKHPNYPVDTQAGAQHLADGLVAVRIHLDHSYCNNGGLEVIEKSHRNGYLPPSELNKALEQPTISLDQEFGAVMLMHPFIVHGSTINTSGERRRVIHCEFLATSLFIDLQKGI